ncbi:MAG TPA: PPOX class F420-dependent oxidoreductase [Acidimicrobiales bacterium]|nr:PPOX class F420-dependent oxidoreductase [Acidimicrobiales bacterium]
MTPTAARDLTVDREELLRFVRPRHRGILSTVRGDGSPQMSPVTIGVDDAGRVVLSTYPERAKARNAARDRRVSVCVLSDEFGGEWVQVDGRATVVAQPEAVEGLVDYFRAISGEHPDWDEYRRAMRAQGKVLVRMEVERWGPISRGGFPAWFVPDQGAK